jgi:polar amino acid transport system substrate-binding protein
MNDVEELFEFMPPREHYFAFSLSTSDDVINSWQKALDSMKKDGTFAKIYKKWLPGKRMPK